MTPDMNHWQQRHVVTIDGQEWHHGDFAQATDGKIWKAEACLTASGENSIIFHTFGSGKGVYLPPSPLKRVTFAVVSQR